MIVGGSSRKTSLRGLWRTLVKLLVLPERCAAAWTRTVVDDDGRFAIAARISF
jgi:hypothetical protein